MLQPHFHLGVQIQLQHPVQVLDLEPQPLLDSGPPHLLDSGPPSLLVLVPQTPQVLVILEQLQYQQVCFYVIKTESVPYSVVLTIYVVSVYYKITKTPSF